MPQFIPPVWNSTESFYDIRLTESFQNDTRVTITRSNSGSTIFSNTDMVTQVTNTLVTILLKEGDDNKWFSKLPTHANLMKRVNNSFKSLATANEHHAVVSSIQMTPKTLMLVWSPVVYTPQAIPGMGFDSDSELESDPEFAESNLPPVPLTGTNQQSREEYLLTRLRAAKARLETEHIRMEYFETTGRMPPDSEEEEEEEEE